MFLSVVEDVKDVHGVLCEQPVDLTGASVYFSVRTTNGSPVLLIGKDTTDSANIEIIPPDTCGNAVVHISPIDTQHMDPGEYVFDIWVVLSTGKRIPVIEPSEFVVKETPTKLA